MKIVSRKKSSPELPGLTGTVRIDRHTPQLLRRLQAGDVVVIDHLDLDRRTAQALVDAEVAAVLNVQPMISGRYANLGPQMLCEAGIVVLDQVDAPALALKDGSAVRLHDGTLYRGEDVVATGRTLDADQVGEQMLAARRGMLGQLSTFTHNSAEFLQREEPLLLHDSALPEVATAFKGRPVVVVGPGAEGAAEFRSLRRFVAEQRPVLIGVDAGADTIVAAGARPDVVVVVAGREDVATTTLAKASDLVVRTERGASRSVLESYERLGARPLAVETAATPEDVALLLGLAGEASVIVAAGLDATLEEFLDGQRGGLASTFLTRLKVGPLLVDAQVVPTLYSGRIRPLHLFWLVLAGLVALAAALSVTPWGSDLLHDVGQWLADTFDSIQGKLS